MADCLSEQGRGRFDNVREARQRKAAYLHNDRAGFLEQLHRELTNFTKLCQRTGERGAVRLNVFSDVKWERYGIPQAHPELLFVDYSKQAVRLGKTPENYKLIFSYSGRPEYRNQNRRAFQTDAPVAVVFRGGFSANVPRAARYRWGPGRYRKRVCYWSDSRAHPERIGPSRSVRLCDDNPDLIGAAS